MLQIGFSRVDITPKLGIELYGYYETRVSDGVLDNLEINTLALALDEVKVLLLSVDHCGITQNIIARFQAYISQCTGVPEEAIYIHATHVHTAPYLVNRQEKQEGLTNIIDTNPGPEQCQIQQQYYQFLFEKVAEGASLALADLKDAKLFVGTGLAPNVGFIRRFRMKDGSVRTNPGVGNPDILEPLGKVDETVSVLKFERDGADAVVLFHYGNHPDILGGCKISADWPGHARRILEQRQTNTKAVFVNGTMGDVNHINVNDPVSAKGGYAYSRHVGQVVAEGVLQALNDLRPVQVDSLKAGIRNISIPSNMPEKADMEQAHRITALHKEGKDEQIPYEGMAKTTEIARAARMVRLEFGPEAFALRLSAIAIGNVVLLGIPGQHFSCAGVEMKAFPGWEMVLPISQIGGSEGYYPPMSAYEEGGYETVASNFKAGVSELLVKESAELLKSL